MMNVIKGLIIFLGIVFIIVLVFSVYANMVVDYSLENLALALTLTDKKSEESDIKVGKAYQSVINELVFQEASTAYQTVVSDLISEEVLREDFDIKNLVSLELASRSLNETVDRAGYRRSQFYLRKVASVKEAGRNIVLRKLDILYRITSRYFRKILSFLRFIKKKIFPPKAEKVKTHFEYTSYLLLSQAEEEARNNNFSKAVQLYKQYLEIYTDHPDRGFVSISLAWVLIRQRQMKEAERILNQLRIAYIGMEEADIAAVMLRKIDSLKEVDKEIGELLRTIPRYHDSPVRNSLRLRLALSYLVSYQFAPAREILEKLHRVQDPEIQRKAQFYLGWMYKLNLDYDNSVNLFIGLLEKPDMEHDFSLGLQAELADIHYRKKELHKAISYYESISEKAQVRGILAGPVREQWVDMAELEQAAIYFFDLKNPVEARRHLAMVGGSLESDPLILSLKNEMEGAAKKDQHDLLFRALRDKKIDLAYELARRLLRSAPLDPWTHSAVATVYSILNEKKRAIYYARRGYHLGVDEYTASVRGYVEGQLTNYQAAIEYYEEAIALNPAYFPAHFNVSYTFLKIGEYLKGVHILATIDRDFSDVGTLMRAKIMNNMAYGLWYLGEADQAEGRLRLALTIYPDYQLAKDNLAKVAIDKKPELAEAIVW